MPKMIALWICASTVSGLTTVPQSTAQTTRRTRTAPSFDDLDFGHLRHDRCRRRTGARRRGPARCGSGCPQPAFSAASVEHGLGARRLVEQRAPIGDRILLRRRRQLVDEALGHEDIVRRPDAAPEGGRNARRLHPHILDVHVREGVDQIDRALGRVGVEAVLERRRQPSRDDRGAGEAMVPGDRHALRVEAGGQPVEEIGPVHVVLDVLLAGPHDLHRAVDLLRDLDGADDAVDLEPPAEAAADQMVVDDDLVQRQAGGLRRRRLGARDDLACRPRPRSRPCGHGPCSSSAPSWRARGTAPGRSPRPWWRRPPCALSTSPMFCATAPGLSVACSSSADDVAPW